VGLLLGALQNMVVVILIVEVQMKLML